MRHSYALMTAAVVLSIGMLHFSAAAQQPPAREADSWISVRALSQPGRPPDLEPPTTDFNAEAAATLVFLDMLGILAEPDEAAKASGFSWRDMEPEPARDVVRSERYERLLRERSERYERLIRENGVQRGLDSNPWVQPMMIESVLKDMHERLVIARHDTAPRSRRVAREWGPMRASFAGPSFLWQERERKQDPEFTPPIQMLITSLGVSTGDDAFKLEIVNNTGAPIAVDHMQLAVTPLAASAARDARRTIERFRARKPTTVTVSGYCLEFLRQPPAAGTLFAVAQVPLQRAVRPARQLLDAARRLRDKGALHPDSEPTGYFHSIRQWALWSVEQGFDEASFTDALVSHTSKTFDAAGRTWTDEMEKVLRAAAPRRWRDIQQVISEARTALR